MNLNQLNEDIRQALTEELSIEDVKNAIEQCTFEDLELFDDDKVRTIEVETMFNTYEIYSLDSQSTYIMKNEDFESYISDIANQFTYCLPDQFERFFDTDLLKSKIQDDFTYSWQAIDFINKNMEDADLDKYNIVGSNDEYVALEDVYENR